MENEPRTSDAPRVLVRDEGDKVTIILAMNDMDEDHILTARAWAPESVTRIFHGSEVVLCKPSLQTVIDNYNRQKEQGLDIFGRPNRTGPQTEPWPQPMPLPEGARVFYLKDEEESSEDK